MTKTLTEKWKDGELTNGSYYVKDWDGTTHRFVAQNKILWRDSNNPIYASERIEVLAAVPSYEEYKELIEYKQRLEFDNESLDAVIKDLNEESSRLVRKIDESDEELKNLACKNDTLAMECGKLQEQLEEANAVITSFPAETLSTCMIALEYLKKWGVK